MAAVQPQSGDPPASATAPATTTTAANEPGQPQLVAVPPPPAPPQRVLSRSSLTFYSEYTLIEFCDFSHYDRSTDCW